MRKPKVVAQPKSPKPPGNGRAHAYVYALLDILYDRDAGDYRKGITDRLLADALGVSPMKVANVRGRNYGGVIKVAGTKPRSDVQRLRMVEDKLDRLIDLMEIAVNAKGRVGK